MLSSLQNPLFQFGSRLGNFLQESSYQIGGDRNAGVNPATVSFWKKIVPGFDILTPSRRRNN
jgi:hypothetical protein